MADKITKFLHKLPPDRYAEIMQVIAMIELNNLINLDVKKMKSSEDLFRVRIGRYRIIFRASDGRNIILAVSKRDDQTYRDY